MTYRRRRQAAMRAVKKREAEDPDYVVKTCTEILNHLGRRFQVKSRTWFNRPPARLP